MKMANSQKSDDQLMTVSGERVVTFYSVLLSFDFFIARLIKQSYPFWRSLDCKSSSVFDARFIIIRSKENRRHKETLQENKIKQNQKSTVKKQEKKEEEEEKEEVEEVYQSLAKSLLWLLTSETIESSEGIFTSAPIAFFKV